MTTMHVGFWIWQNYQAVQGLIHIHLFEEDTMDVERNIARSVMDVHMETRHVVHSRQRPRLRGRPGREDKEGNAC